MFLFESFCLGGSNAEVYWESNAYHRGGYAYRLCRVHQKEYWKVTEECFQQGHLNFAGKKYGVELFFHIINSKEIQLGSWTKFGHTILIAGMPLT